jgi:exopolysaccharide biosynthesis polyprenyl glycosylphosphotransferase
MLADELRKQKAIFAFGDALALMGAFVAALSLHDPSQAIEHRFLDQGLSIDLSGVGAVILLWLAVFRWNDLYRMRNGGSKEVIAIVLACAEGTLLTLLAGFLLHVAVARITVAIACLLAMLFVITIRTWLRFLIVRLYANPKISVPLVLVGFNDVAKYLCDQVLDEVGPYEPVMFVDYTPGVQQYRGLPVLPMPERFDDIHELFPGAEVAIAIPEGSREEIQKITALCDDSHLDWWLVPWLIPSLAAGLKIEQIGLIPLIGRRGSKIEGLNFAIKRAFDVTLAALLLIASSPILLLSSLLILLDDGAPVFFRQLRIGAHGEPFEMLKLRTMTAASNDSVHRDFTAKWIRQESEACASTDSEERLFKLTNDRRVTRIGRILRRFSIDELPQLINVARGQMSLIGPRPGLPYEIELYQNWHRRRLEAVPGITGLWQVSGRNQLSFDEMVRLDVQYLEDWSLLGDLKILARTLPALLRGSGV